VGNANGPAGLAACKSLAEFIYTVHELCQCDIARWATPETP
jgi:hypothetical protein